MNTIFNKKNRILFTCCILIALTSAGISVKNENRAKTHSEKFNKNSIAGWAPGTYLLTPAKGEMCIKPLKTELWASCTYSFKPVDISEKPVISLRIKATSDMNLAIAIGNTETADTIFPVRTRLHDRLASQEILKSNSYNVYSYDFTGVTGIDLSRVTCVRFLVNPFTNETDGEFFIDDFSIGKSATIVPSIGAIQDLTFTATSALNISKTVVLRNITDGTDETNEIKVSAFSSDTLIVKHPKIDYTCHSRTGKLVITPKPGVTGKAQITLTLSAKGAATKEVVFFVTVVPNSPPSMDSLRSVMVERGKEFALSLSGIWDGNPESDQLVSIAACSSDKSAITDDFKIEYSPYSTIGKLKFTPLITAIPGTDVNIRISLKDNGGNLLSGCDSAEYIIPVTVFEKINLPPCLLCPVAVNNFKGAGIYSLPLEDISDGNDEMQAIQFKILNTNPEVVSDLYVDSLSGDKAVFHYTLTGVPGISTITLIASDSLPATISNGKASYQCTFEINAREPVTSWSENFSKWDPATWKTEGPSYKLITVDDTLHVMSNLLPFTYPNIQVDLKSKTGKEIDITRNPFLSLKVKAGGTNTNKPSKITIGLVDYKGNFNIGNPTSDKGLLYIPADDNWHTFTIDYRNSFALKPDFLIDPERIIGLLINIDCTWFQKHSGEFWITDVRLGDLALNKPTTIARYTANKIPDQVVIKGDDPKPVSISGINDGRGNVHADIDLFSSNPAMVSNLNVAEAANGNALLTYKINPLDDRAKVFIVLHDKETENEVKDTISFTVLVADTAKQKYRADITVDTGIEYQTITGFGSYVPVEASPRMMRLLRDMNYSVMRISDAFAQVERTNDNDDPHSLELRNLNPEGLRLESAKAINELTFCHKFYFTVFSPPAWMKYNKSLSVHLDAQYYADNNKLNPDLYEEYAEYVVGIIRLYKEKAGVDIFAICPQNEPEFNEPYASCQVTGEEFAAIIKVLGEKFKKEGITTKIILPEDISTHYEWVSGKVEPVIADKEAAKYFDILAVHNYDTTGIRVGPDGLEKWIKLRELKEKSPAKELWMSETSGFVDDWAGISIKDYMLGNWIFAPGAFEISGVIYNAFKYGHITTWSGYGDIETEIFKPNILAVTKQFSRFITPGSIMVEIHSDNPDVLVLAFKDTSYNSLAVIIINRSNDPVLANIAGDLPTSDYYAVTTQEGLLFANIPMPSKNRAILPPRSITSIFYGKSGYGINNTDKQ